MYFDKYANKFKTIFLNVSSKVIVFPVLLLKSYFV